MSEFSVRKAVIQFRQPATKFGFLFDANRKLRHHLIGLAQSYYGSKPIVVRNRECDLIYHFKIRPGSNNPTASTAFENFPSELAICDERYSPGQVSHYESDKRSEFVVLRFLRH